jgi:hypothetical protein
MSAIVMLTAFSAHADDLAKRAEAKLDKETFEVFKSEIKDQYPDHVTAYAIVKAKVEGVKEVLYCPLRTSQCGMNPTCNHPKRKTTTVDITIGEPVITSSDTALPKAFKDYIYFGKIALAKGDDVYLSLYVYKHQVTKDGNSHISKIAKIAAAPKEKK